MPHPHDGIVLCGGAGLRLRSVIGDAPKAMSIVSGRPFLEILLRQLARHGFERAVLAVGYRHDVIRAHFGERALGLDLAYSIEESPLGTGGALRLAADLIVTDSVLVVNGDSYADVDLAQFVRRHEESMADVSLVTIPPDGRGDCGSVIVGGDGDVVQFAEKEGLSRAGYFNAGIYMLARRLIREIPAGTELSLERDLFPRWLHEGRKIKAFVYSGACIDIGTPERFERAQSILENVEIETTVTRGEDQL
jgi:NDP-sugar pyrophosphorylase family protein